MSKFIDVTMRLIDNFTSPLNGAVTKMQNSAKATMRAGKQIERAGKSISGIGTSITAGVTVPIVGLGVAAVNMASDFTDAMAKVNTIAKLGGDELGALKDQVVALSNEVGVGVNDLAEAQYQAISAGVDTADSVEFVGLAVKAAKGGFTDAATAIDGLTTAMNAYGVQGLDAAQAISDQMLIAQNFGKTTFGDMASSMGKVIPIASSLNVSTEELFASIATLTKNGIATAESVTGLKAAYSNILKPTDAAMKTAEKLGIEFNSTHLKAVGWAKFLDEIKTKVGDDADAMASLFGSTEALNTVMVLAGKGSGDFNAALSEMGKSAGATEDAYNQMITPSEQMAIALNKVKNSCLQLGDALTPVFEKVADVVSLVGDKLNSLTDEQVDSIVKWGAIAATVGPIVLIFGKVVTHIGTIVVKFGKLGSMLSRAGSIGALVTGPAGIVIATLGALIAAGILVYKNWEKIKETGAKAWGKIKSIIKSSGVDFDALKEKGIALGGKVVEVWGKIKGAILSFWNVVKPIFKLLVGLFEFVLPIALSGLTACFGTCFGGIMEIVGHVIDGFGGLADFISNIFCKNLREAFEGLKTYFGNIVVAIVEVVKTPINALISLVNGAINALNKIGIKIPDWVPGGLGGKELGFSIPTIPMLYTGVDDWQGGPAMVHDRGAEIIDLPSGSRVYPHDKSLQMARQEGAASAGRSNITIAKLADSIIVREDADIDKITTAIVDKLVRVANNTGGVAIGNMA